MVISTAGRKLSDAVTCFWKMLIQQNQLLLWECVVSSPKNKTPPACLPDFLPICPVSSQLANGLRTSLGSPSAWSPE